MAGSRKRIIYFCFVVVAASAPLLVVPATAQEAFESEHEQEYRQAAFLRTHSDSTGTPRPDLWRKGIEQFLAMKAAQASEPGPPNLGTTWTQIGPQPLMIDQVQEYQGTGPDSGEVVDIAIDPSGTTDSTIYIATNDGGVWKTTDGGTNWAPMTDFGCPGLPGKQCPSLSMGAVTVDPLSTSTVYAGTGNPFDGSGGRNVGPYNGFTKGVGIYKSVDGGASWQVLDPGGIFSGDHNHQGVAINRIVVWYPRPLGVAAIYALLVATNQGLFRSIDGGIKFGNNAPNFDNGQPVKSGYITDLKLDTVNSAVYAAVMGQGIFLSMDGGTTFSTNLFTATNGGSAPGTYCFVSIAQSTQPNNLRLYASVEALRTGGACVGGRLNQHWLGIYRSDDGGAHWAVQPGATWIGNGSNAIPDWTEACQCGYDQTIGVDPQDQNRVYLGFQELYLSTNGGGSFIVPATTRNQVHFDHHAIYFSPQSHWGGSSPTRVWVGTDGGIATSLHGAGTWDNMNGTFPNAIATNLFKYIDIGRNGAFNNGFTVGGTQDCGTIEHQYNFAPNEWHLAVDGDGSAAAVDPLSAWRMYGAENGVSIYSKTGGNTWSYLVPSVWRYAIDPVSTSNVFSSSSLGDGFYPGSAIYRSIYYGLVPTLIHTSPSPARAIAVARTGPGTDLLWLGLDDGSAEFTLNALAPRPVFTAVPPPINGVIGTPIGGVAINPNNPNDVTITYEGFTGAHVFRTPNGGTNWNNITGNLPDLPTHSVVLDTKTTPPTIVVSNDAGVMATTNGGASWQVLGTGLPTVDSTSLQIDTSTTPSLLRVGTYGRSVWELK